MNITVQVINKTTDEPIEGVTVSFDTFFSRGELTNTTDTTNATGYAGTGYIPVAADIDKDQQLEITGGGDRVGPYLSVTASADRFANETADPDPVDPGNRTEVAAQLKDELDRDFSDANVTFSLDSGTGEIVAVSQDTSDANGWVNATYEAADTDAGETVTINVTANATDANTTIPVGVTANVDTFDTVAATPTDPAAAENVTVSARMLDESGDPLDNTSVGVAANGSGTVAPDRPESNATGFFNTTYVPAPVDNGTTVAFTLGPGTAGETNVTASFANVTLTDFTNASAPDSLSPGANATVTAVAEDEFGEPLSNATVDLETDGDGTLNVTQVETDANGTVAASYRSADTDAGSVVQVNITANETAAETNVTIPVGATADSIRNVTGTPDPQDPGSSVTVSAEVRDEAGNLLQGANVTFNATADSGNLADPGSFAAGSATSDTDGEVNTTFTPSDAAAGRTLNVSVVANTTGVQNSTTLNVSANPTALLTKPAGPDVIDPGEVTNVSVAIRDESGDPLSGADVTFTDNGTGTLTVGQATSNESGWVNATYTAGDTDAGGAVAVNVTTDADASVNGTVVFDVTANPASFSNVTVDPTQPEPDESTNLSVRVRDESDDVLGDIGVELNVTSGNGSLADVPSNSSESGWINASYTPVGTDANTTVDVEVTANATDANRTISFDVDPRAASEFNRTAADPSEIDPIAVGMRSNETTVGVQVIDQVGEALGDAEVNFTVTTGNGTLDATSATSTDDGWANVTYSAVGDDADRTVEITADAVGRSPEETINISVTANPTTFTNTTVDPSQPEPNESTNLSVRLRDESGDIVGDTGVELNVTSGNGSLAGVPSNSSDTGWINASYTPAGTDANTTVNVEVSANETVANTTVSFEVAERAAGEFNQTVAAPAEIDPIAVGTRSNETTVGVQVLDQVGEELTGANVSFTVTTGNGTLNVSSTNSSADGWANVSYTAVGDDADTTVKIDADAVDRDPSATISLEVTQNPTNFTNATVTPAHPEPDQTTDLAVRLRDESGDPLSGAGVELNVSEGNASLTGVPSTSNASGWINASYTPTGPDANTTVRVNVSANQTVANTTVSFEVGPRAASEFNQSVADPAEIDPIAVGERNNETTVGVRVLDQVGEALAGANISFTVTTGNGTLNDTSTNSSADGWANVTYSAVGDDANTTVEIEADAVDRSPVENITVGVTANPTNFTAERAAPEAPEPNESATVGARLLDESADPLSGEPIEFTTNGSGHFETTDSETNATGDAEAVYIPASDDANGTVVGIEAPGSETVFTNVTLDVGPLAANGFANESLSPGTVDPITEGDRDNETTISAQVLDQFGNSLDDSTVTFSDNGAAGEFVATNTTSNATGWVNATYAAARGDANSTVELSINVTDRDAETNRTLDVTASPDSFAQTAADPDPVDPGNSPTITAQVDDESGDPLPNADIEFVVADGNGTFSGDGTSTTKSTNDTGFVEVVYDPDRTDANTTLDVGLEATDTGLTTNVTVEIEALEPVTVTAEPADPAEIDPVDTGSRNNVTNLSAQLTDEFDEPFVGGDVTFGHNGSGTITVDQARSNETGWVNATYAAAREDVGSTVAVDVTADETRASATISFDVTTNPDSVQDTTVSADPAPPNQSVTVGATVVDENDTDYQGADVTFGIEDGNGSLSTTTDRSDADGLVATTYTPVRTDANGTIAINITANQTGANTTATFEMDPLSPDGFGSEQATPEPVDPGNATALATRVLDEFGQPYTGNDTADPFQGANVTFTLDSGNGTLAVDQDTNDPEGWVNATYTAAGKDADTEVVVGVAADDTDAETDIRFNVTANPTTFTNATVSPPVPEPNETATVAVRLRDESDDPLPDTGVELNVTGGNNSLKDVPSESNGDGWVNATYTPNGSDANTTVRVNVTANETIANTTVDLDVGPRAADTFNESLADPTVIDPIARGVRDNETTVSVRVLDQVDEALGGANVSFTVTSGAGDINGTTTNSTNSSADGWANVTYSAAADDAAQTVEIQAEAVGRDVSESISLDVQPNPTNLTNATVTPPVPEPNESATVAVRVRDESGDPLPDASVELNVTEGNSSLVGVPSASNASGWVNATYTPNGPDANTTVRVNVTANDTAAYREVAFDVGPRAADEFNQSLADPAEIDPIERGVRTNETTVGVRVLDQVDEALGGANVSFTVTSGAGDINGTTTNSTNSSADGWANVTYSAAADDADQTVEIQADAVDRDVSETISLTVQPNPTTLTNATVTPPVPEPNESATVAVRVRDESGDPLPDAGVELNVTEGNSSLVGVPSASNASGWVNATYTPNGSDANTTVRVNVTANDTAAYREVAFDVGPRAADAFNESLADPAEIDPIAAPKRTNETTVGVRVLDQVRDPLGGANVSFTVTTGEGTLNTSSTNSTADGWANVSYTAVGDDADTTVKIDADAVGRDPSSRISLDVTENPTTFTNTTVTPTVPEPNETTDLAVRLRDESGDPLGDANVTLNVTAGNSSLTGVPSASNGSGWVNASYTPNGSDANTTVRVNVSANTTVANTTISFDVDERAAELFRNGSTTPVEIDPVATGERSNTTVVAAQVLDQVYDPLSGANVSFEIESGGGEVTPIENVSNATGWVNATYAANRTDAGDTVEIDINATGRDAETNLTVDVTRNPDSFGSVSAVAGAEPNETVDITATVLDEDGVAIDGQEIRFSANRTGTFTNSSGSFTNATVTSDGSGYVETDYEPVRADANETVAITINATATSAKTVTTATLPPLAATTITEVNATPESVAPGNETLVNATVRDQFGQPLDGADVAFTDTGPGTLTPIRNTSIDGGVVNATYEPADSEANTTVSVSIDAADRAVSETVSFDVTANPTTFTNVTVDPTEPEPNETTDLAVRVRDESSDPLADANVTLNVTAGNSSLTGVPAASDSAGWINASYTPNGSDANTTVHVNVTANETDANTTVAVDVGPRAAESFTAETTADAEIDPVATGDRENTTTVAARVLDQVEDPLGGAPVNFTVTAGTGRLTGVPTETNASGWANATYAANRTDANTTVEVTINATGRAVETNLTINVTSNPDAVTNVSFDPNPADAGDTVRINATVVDESDTEFAGANVTFTDNGSASVVPVENTSLANGTVIGEYTPDATDANETVEIGIEVNETVANTTAVFEVNRLRADEFRNADVTPDPADPGETVTVTAEVLDSLDQPIEGEAVDFTTNGSGDLTHVAATSRNDGTVEAAYTVAKADAGETLSLNSTANRTEANTTVTLDVAELAITSFDNTTTTPAEIDPVDDGTRDNTAVLSARVLDQVGDPLDNAPVDLNITHGNGTLIDEPTQSNTTGWVTATYEADAADANTTAKIAVNATETTAETNLTVNVTANPDALIGFSLPDEIDPGEDVSVTGVVEDESGTPYEGETITIFRRPGTDSQFDPSQVTSNDTGHITTTLSASPNDAGETAEYSLSGTIIGQRVSVDVTENADEFRNVAANPDPVGPNETVTVSAKVLNEQDQDLDGADVTVTTDGNGTISPTTTTSSGDGSITTTYDPVRSDADTNVTVTIAANDTDAETNTTVEVGVLEPVALTDGTATPGRVEPNEQTTINATVRDQFGVPFPGANVSFNTTTNGTLTPRNDTSGSNGTVTATFRPTAEENATINLSVEGTAAATNVSVRVLELTPTSFGEETATPEEIAAGDRTNLSMRAFDQLGNPLPGGNISFETDGNGTLGAAYGTTDADGYVNTSYSAVVSDIRETVTVGFNATNGSANTTLAVDVVPTPQGFANVTTDPASVEPGEPVNVSATVVDERDDPLSGATVAFDANRSAAFDPAENTTVANGSVETTYTPLAGGNATLNLTATETGVSTSIDVGVAALAPTDITDSSLDPNPAYPGQNVTVTATVRDQLGDPFEGATVAFNATGNGTSGNGTLSALNDSSGPNGEVTTVYKAASEDLDAPVTLELNVSNSSLNASATLTVRSRPQDEPDDSGGGSDSDTEIIVGEIDGGSGPTDESEVGDDGETPDGSEATDGDDSADETELTDIRGSSSAIRVENPPAEEAVTLDESTTGLPSLSETETTSLEGVSVSVSGRESYWINSTSYDYESVSAAGIQADSQSEPEQSEATEQSTERITEEVEPADTVPTDRSSDGSSASSSDSGAAGENSEAEAFADFERRTNRVPVGYLQVDTTAAPETVERVVFSYRVKKSRLEADGVSPEEIELYRKGESGWGSLETTHVRETDTHHWFESESPGLSVFPIATDRQPVEITGASLTTTEVRPDEQATVTVSIDHRGLVPNTTDLTLSANGETVTTETVTIQPNITTTVEVPFQADAEGEYELTVEGRTAGTLTVDSLELADVIEPVDDALGDGSQRRWLVAGLVVLLLLAAWRRF